MNTLPGESMEQKPKQNLGKLLCGCFLKMVVPQIIHFFLDHFNILAQVFQTGDSTYSREPLSTPDHEFGRHTQRLPCPATHYNCWCACNIAAFPSKIPDPCDGLSATCKPFRIDTNPIIVIPNWEFFDFFIPSLGFVVSLAGTPTKAGFKVKSCWVGPDWFQAFALPPCLALWCSPPGPVAGSTY